MQLMAAVLMACLVPFGVLFLLLGMSWLEDTLVEDVEKSSRAPAPDPITRVPVKAEAPLREPPHVDARQDVPTAARPAEDIPAPPGTPAPATP